MKFKRYLAVRKNGATRISVNKPSLATDEIAIQLNLEIPDQLFMKPTLVADIRVDDELARQELISTEVIDNAKQLISDSLGLQLKITTVYNEEKELVEKE